MACIATKQCVLTLSSGELCNRKSTFRFNKTKGDKRGAVYTCDHIKCRRKAFHMLSQDDKRNHVEVFVPKEGGWVTRDNAIPNVYMDKDELIAQLSKNLHSAKDQANATVARCVKHVGEAEASLIKELTEMDMERKAMDKERKEMDMERKAMDKERKAMDMERKAMDKERKAMDKERNDVQKYKREANELRNKVIELEHEAMKAWQCQEALLAAFGTIAPGNRNGLTDDMMTERLAESMRGAMRTKMVHGTTSESRAKEMKRFQVMLHPDKYPTELKWIFETLFKEIQ